MTHHVIVIVPFVFFLQEKKRELEGSALESAVARNAAALSKVRSTRIFGPVLLAG